MADDPAIHVVRYPNGDITRCFAMLYEARAWQGSLVLEEAEVTEAAFHDPHTPPAPLHGPTVAVLDMYLRFLETREFQNR